LQNIAINGYENHEREVVKLIKNYSWDMKNFYDIGANVGFYSILVELYHKQSLVFAVEPFPLNVKYIKNLIKTNNLKFSVIDKAIDKTDGENINFYFPTGENSSKLAASGSLINSFKGTSGVFKDLPFKVTSVETMSLDTLISNKHECTLVKIDSEGNEFNILSHSSLLKSNCVDFIIEIMINDSDKHEVFNHMIENGYTGYLITNAGLIKEDRPLTLPRPDRGDRTLWRNHFFTKKPVSEIKQFSIDNYGYWI
jgi:FkbM family methyltransferase